MPGGSGHDGAASPESHPAPARLEEKGSRPGWIPWAELLKRVYAYEVLVCDRCGGTREVLAFLTEGETVRKFLECVGLSSDIPPISPPRVSWATA
ncbi:MAG: hypothetical protein HY720_33175 [Planctomycetes bacterium]|nr:hypothetical protein [Planctomycetota bacterium]